MAKCKGLYFKGSAYQVVFTGVVGQITELRLIKGLSCTGCPECEKFWKWAKKEKMEFAYIESGCFYTPMRLEGEFEDEYTFVLVDELPAVNEG